MFELDRVVKRHVVSEFSSLVVDFLGNTLGLAVTLDVTSSTVFTSELNVSKFIHLADGNFTFIEADGSREIFVFDGDASLSVVSFHANALFGHELNGEVEIFIVFIIIDNFDRNSMFCLFGTHFDEATFGCLILLARGGGSINTLDHEDDFFIDLLCDLHFKLSAALTNYVVEALESDLFVLFESFLLGGLQLLSDNLGQVSARVFGVLGVLLAESNTLDRVIGL